MRACGRRRRRRRECRGRRDIGRQQLLAQRHRYERRITITEETSRAEDTGVVAFDVGAAEAPTTDGACELVEPCPLPGIAFAEVVGTTPLGEVAAAFAWSGQYSGECSGGVVVMMLTRPTALLPCFLLFMAACGAQRGSESTSIEGVQSAAAEPIAEYVVEVFEDSRGILWFGTMNKGVARYDGKTLTYLTEEDGLCGDTISRIAEDKNGALWFAGHTGVCRYDPLVPLPSRGQAFTRFFDTEGWVSSDRSGEIWVGTNGAVHRFDGNAMVPFEVPLEKKPAAIYSIAPGRISFELEDSRGNLWFRTDGAGAYRYDGKGFQQFTKQDGLCSNTVWSIVEDRQGRIWFGCIQASQPEMTGDGGVCILEGERFTTFPQVKGLTGNDIYTLYPDRSGNIWIGATGVGVYRHDGQAFTLFDETDRPDLNGGFGLQGMLEDQHGTLWFGFSGGLFRFDGKRFVHVGPHSHARGHHAWRIQAALTARKQNALRTKRSSVCRLVAPPRCGVLRRAAPVPDVLTGA